MLTEPILRHHPALVKALTGMPADEFWALVQKTEDALPAYERQRHQRPDRQRAAGAGHPYDQPIAIRVASVLTYLRLHVPQIVVALLFGGTQSEVSRDLRRLLPLLRQGLPCPAVWQVVEEGDPLDEKEVLADAALAEGRALVDATEQRVSRPQNSEQRQAHYSGKKKAFTVKTQLVTDGEHHLVAMSAAVPGAIHDKKLSDAVQTVERLPEGCEVDADKGYQGLAAEVRAVTVIDTETGQPQQVPRVTVHTPFKKPRGGALTEEQSAFNRWLNAIRVRIEHCIGWAKNWAILATRFRCAHSIYTSIMQLVCGLVNAQTQRWQAQKAANCA